MPKQKSSASSATRKKHARKAGGSEQQLPLPKEKKLKEKGKGKNKEPKQKVYIRPTKPAPIQPDPLDSLGLAKQLPPDLVVVLSRLGKRDSVTKWKALEDLQADWVTKVLADGDNNSVVEAALVTALPVWLHHLPALFFHPSHRIRLAASGLHLLLLRIPSILQQVVYFLREVGSDSQVESVLGSWCMAAQDIDKQVSIQARKSWELAVHTSAGADLAQDALTLDDASLNRLVSFAERSLLDPMGVYADLFPVHRAFAHAPVQPLRKGSARHATPTPTRASDDDAPRAKAEDEEESMDDRRGRLRVGALGVLKWLLDSGRAAVPARLAALLEKPPVWTALFPGATPTFCESGDALGDGQPAVRRAAWAVLHSLLKGWKGEVERILPLLSSAVLRSAWLEPDAIVRTGMWQPLLIFLTQYPKSWEIDMIRPLSSPEDPDEDTGEEDEERDETSTASEGDKDEVRDRKAQKPDEKEAQTQVDAYHEFLQFLQLGCSGSPLEGYPTVVVILSTMPPSLLGHSSESWADFFTSFWAALDGRALSSLDRAKASAAFLGALLECLVFLLKRKRAALGASDRDNFAFSAGDVAGVVEQQAVRTWDELAARRLRVDGDIAGKLVAGTLMSLDAMHEDLFSAAWAPIASSARDAFASTDTASSELLVAVLKACDDQFKIGSAPRTHVRGLIRESTGSAIEQSEALLSKSGREETSPQDVPLTKLVNTFGDVLFADVEIASRLDKLVRGNISPLLLLTPSLLITYLRHRKNAQICSALWCTVLSVLATDQAVGEHGLRALLDAAEKHLLPGYLKPENDELDSFAGRLVSEALSGYDAAQLSNVRRLLQHPDHFLARRSAAGLLHSIVYAFSEKTRRLLHDALATESATALQAPLELLKSVIDARPEVTSSEDVRMFLPDIFIFGYLFPRSAVFTDSPESAFALARQIWETCVSRLGEEDREILTSTMKGVLRDVIADVDSRPMPLVVLETFSEGILGSDINVLQDLFPPEDQLDEMLRSLPSNPIDPTLAIVNPLVPPPSLWSEGEVLTSSYDLLGYSDYARTVNALLHVLIGDRQLARENMWALRHFLVLAHAARELLQVPDAKSAVFRHKTSETALRDIIVRVQKATTFLLSAPIDEGWHAAITTSSNNLVDPMGRFVAALLAKSQDADTYLNSVVLHAVLQHVLGGASKEDADLWLLFARKIEKRSPRASIVIVSAVTTFAPEPPRLDRYRNELAADIMGIAAAQANTKGLLLLRRLGVTAPDPDSDIVFLPQPRAVNFMRACQQWVTSDEDLDEEVESEMTLIFFHLAPILQDLSGAHWDLIFDIIENNLENSSFADSSTLVLLARTCRLLIAVRELTTYNKALRAAWSEREISILTLLRDVVANAPASSDVSVPRSVCWEMALAIVQDIPTSLIDHNTLSAMCHLLLDSSVVVQKMAYSLLNQAARKRTEHFVVEAAVDTSGEVEFELPPELLEILREALDQRDREPNPLGFLLGWMMVFDLFNDASLKVKLGYAGQLRDLDLIASNFLPNVLDWLDLYGGKSKLLRLDHWAVDEYYIQLYDAESPLSLKLLAAHLFYRALLNVPSLITTWWSECKDKGLSMAVASLTARHFSPVLIAAELAHVNDPDTVAELTGENWQVKVLTAINEVVASCVVDEQTMEVRIKIPADYPLHSVEVRDDRRVAVDERRWRGWILAVQQVVTSRNGRIVDGLSIFKKNVMHYFEDQIDCAICYSIISVTDLTLPNKKCKTCSNRFHASCLYKWFSTSHSSSCPLCRSDFL